MVDRIILTLEKKLNFIAIGGRTDGQLDPVYGSSFFYPTDKLTDARRHERTDE